MEKLAALGEKASRTVGIQFRQKTGFYKCEKSTSEMLFI